LDRTARALKLKDRPENNPKCPLYLRRVQFASMDAMYKAGVDVDRAGQRPMVEAIRAHGEITYDQTRLVRLSSPLAGRVAWVGNVEGDQVKQGDVLALIDAADVGKAKGEYLRAFAGADEKARLLENVQDLIRQGTYVAGASQDVEARAALREAEIRLASAEQSLLNWGLGVQSEALKRLPAEEVARRVRFLGLPDSVIKKLKAETLTANLIPITAPHDGVVASREVVAGANVDSSKLLFVVVDTNRMWLMLNVRQEDARYLSRGQEVRFESDVGAVRTKGTVTWISTSVDEKTRTVKVRAELDNPSDRDHPQGRLRASTFGAGKIVLRDETTVVVPSQAVHWDGSCHVVFVRDKDFVKKDAPKFFHTRTVRPGAKDDEFTEIIAGVLPGEWVASKGSAILRASLLKNNLGAG
jgi:cobalt-zinc-cadmium efflux system membrane fusion protein